VTSFQKAKRSFFDQKHLDVPEFRVYEGIFSRNMEWVLEATHLMKVLLQKVLELQGIQQNKVKGAMKAMVAKLL